MFIGFPRFIALVLVSVTALVACSQDSESVAIVPLAMLVANPDKILENRVRTVGYIGVEENRLYLTKDHYLALDHSSGIPLYLTIEQAEILDASQCRGKYLSVEGMFDLIDEDFAPLQLGLSNVNFIKDMREKIDCLKN